MSPETHNEETKVRTTRFDYEGIITYTLNRRPETTQRDPSKRKRVKSTPEGGDCFIISHTAGWRGLRRLAALLADNKCST